MVSAQGSESMKEKNGEGMLLPEHENGRLFDYFVVVSHIRVPPTPTDEHDAKIRWYPSIRDSVPPNENIPFASSLPIFCFPDNEQPILALDVTAEAMNEASFSTFVLTGDNNARLYASCLKRYEVMTCEVGIENTGTQTEVYAVPVSLVFLSYIPCFNLCYSLLLEIWCVSSVNYKAPLVLPERNTLAITKKESSLESHDLPIDLTTENPDEGLDTGVPLDYPLEKMLVNVVTTTPLPPPGSCLRIKLYRRTVEWSASFSNSLPLVYDGFFMTLFQLLAPEGIVGILESLLLEKKVLLHSHNIDELTPCCEALLGLLFPFTWQYSYVPCLPLQLREYVEVMLYIFSAKTFLNGTPNLAFYITISI